jgi:hypothetical protein
MAFRLGFSLTCGLAPSPGHCVQLIAKSSGLCTGTFTHTNSRTLMKQSAASARKPALGTRKDASASVFTYGEMNAPRLPIETMKAIPLAAPVPAR